MKIQKRISCFETNSSSAHTVTFKNPGGDFKKPDYIEIGKADFDYCGDTVEGYQNKANYLWDIIMQHSNPKWTMRFITYLANSGIQVSFDEDWVNDYDCSGANLPWDSEGEELLLDYLGCKSSLMEFLFNDNLIVKLYEG